MNVDGTIYAFLLSWQVNKITGFVGSFSLDINFHINRQMAIMDLRILTIHVQRPFGAVREHDTVCQKEKETESVKERDLVTKM